MLGTNLSNVLLRLKVIPATTYNGIKILKDNAVIALFIGINKSMVRKKGRDDYKLIVQIY